MLSEYSSPPFKKYIVIQVSVHSGNKTRPFNPKLNP